MPMTLHYNDVNPGSLNEHILLVLTSDSVLAPHPGVNAVVKCNFVDV